MRRPTCLFVAAAILMPGVVSADDRADYAKAADQLARALVLAAADRGPDPALDAAGPALPPSVQDVLRQAASHPRVADMRDLGDDLELKGEMVSGLIDEIAGAKAAIETFASDAGARLSRDLGWLETHVKRLEDAAQALGKSATSTKSLKEARKAPQGVALARLAAQAPLIRLRLRNAHDAPARYEALARLFDHPADRLAHALLVLLPRTLKAASAESAAVGDADALRGIAAKVANRLETLARTFEGVTDAAAEAVRTIRTRELSSVVQGDRTPPFSEVVPLVTAFRRQFDEPPALEATAAFDVYRDTKSARLQFWIRGEKRWVAGSARVDPLDAVQRALLDCEDPILRAQALNPRSLAAVYLLFEAAEQVSFSKGLEKLEAGVGAAAKRLKAMRATAREAGLSDRDLDDALARHAGIPALLLEDERRLREHLLRAVIEGGQARGLELLKASEAAAAALLTLRVNAYRVTLAGAPPEARLDLVWRTDDRRWVGAPPTRQRASEPLVAVRLDAAAGAPKPLELLAGTEIGDDTRTGTAQLAAGKDTALTLKSSAPRLVHSAGRVKQIPQDSVPLILELSSGETRRPLRPELGGGRIARDPADPAGTYTVQGRTAAGEVAATLTLELKALRGVVLGTDERVTRVDPDTKSVPGRVHEGGEVVDGEHTFQVRGAEGELLQTNPGKLLDWEARVPTGRYLIETPDSAPAPIGVSRVAPHVTLARSAFGPASESVAPGEGALLRLDLWPTVVADEVLEVRWTVGDQEVVTRPRPGLPGQVLLLPIRVGDEASGKRPLKASVLTARGAFDVEGSLTIKAGPEPVEILLLDSSGKAAESQALALGGERLLRANGVRDGQWTLIGPAGVRALAPRFDGQVPLILDAREPEGRYAIWLSGTRNGARVFGTLALQAFPIGILKVPTPADPPTVGSTLELAIPAPAGFEPPLRVRLGKGPWAPGSSISLSVRPENVVDVSLADSAGRLAHGSVSFAGKRSARALPSKGPRFGILANTDEQVVYAADHALITSYLENETLPQNLAVLERGPLTAAGVRDRLIRSFPYDGPASGRQFAYRSKRFWASLQRSARERLDELEVPEGTVYTIKNSPSPGGEFTLHDRVAQLLAKDGGWSYTLTQVRVRADGLEPHPEQAEDTTIKARLNNASLSKSGGAVGRVTVPGPLGTLELVPLLPETLDLSKDNRILFSLGAKRRRLVPNPYPNDWQLLAKKARLSPQLEVELSVSGKTVKATGRTLGKSATGVDTAIVFVHTGTELHEDYDQKPRKAEAHELRVGTFARPPEAAPLAFEPLTPGVLDNHPEELTILVRARLDRALSAAAWPKERARPDPVRIDGVPFYLETEDLRVATIELSITYVRAAPGGPEPPPRPGPNLGDLRAGGDAKPAAAVDKALARASAYLKTKRWEFAEAAARDAIAGAPSDPRPWALLAEISLAKGLSAQAIERARWSLGSAPTPHGWAIIGEAAYAEGDVDAALEALKRGLALQPKGEVKRRLERLRAELE